VYITEVSSAWHMCLIVGTYWLSMSFLAVAFPFVIGTDLFFVTFLISGFFCVGIFVGSFYQIETLGVPPEEIYNQMLAPM
jgi:hypothetical protein